MAGVLLVFVAAAFPNYLLSQRQPYAKEGWDYSQVADLITTHAQPGDCLLIDNTVGWAPGPIRALTATRPAAFRPLFDIERAARGPDHGALWDGHVAVWLVMKQLDKCSTVWTISSRDKTLPDHESGRSLPTGTAFGSRACLQIPGRTRVPHCRAVAIPPRSGRQVDPLTRPLLGRTIAATANGAVRAVDRMPRRGKLRPLAQRHGSPWQSRRVRRPLDRITPAMAHIPGCR